MTDETNHIATTAVALDDSYAALSQHLHGDGDGPTAATGKEVMPDASTKPIQQPDTSPRLTAGAHPACATHDFGDNA